MEIDVAGDFLGKANEMGKYISMLWGPHGPGVRDFFGVSGGLWGPRVFGILGALLVVSVLWYS